MPDNRQGFKKVALTVSLTESGEVLSINGSALRRFPQIAVAGAGHPFLAGIVNASRARFWRLLTVDSTLYYQTIWAEKKVIWVRALEIGDEEDTGVFFRENFEALTSVTGYASALVDRDARIVAMSSRFSSLLHDARGKRLTLSDFLPKSGYTSFSGLLRLPCQIRIATRLSDQWRVMLARPSRPWLELAFNAAQRSPQASFFMTLEGRILSWNKSAEKLYEYTEEEAVGRNFTMLAPADRMDEMEGILHRLRAGKGVRQLETIREKKDGSLLPVSHVIHLGRARGVGAVAFVVSSDLTETRDIEERLRQAAKMEALGRLSGCIAHNFNNLLNVIVGYGSMLADELPADGELGRFATAIVAASERGADLSSQLLAFSRRSPAVRKRILMDHLLREASGMLPNLMGGDVNLILRLNAPDCAIEADRSQIQRALLNLAVNASDAMPAGGELTVSTTVEEVGLPTAGRHHVVPGQYVVLAVADTGVGMDQETLSHLYEPFFTTKSQGKGFGLSTVHGIVSMHKGFVTAESQPGCGATFKLHFPVMPAPLSAAPQTALPTSLRGVETILAVEDEPAILRLMTETLRRLGYAVVGAADGRQAMEWVSSKLAQSGEAGIDLLLSDVIMPGVDGWALAKTLRDQIDGLPVLLCSGDAGAAHIDSALPDGYFFLQKPFHPRQLAEKVRGLLDARFEQESRGVSR
jgi:PAS domain S-box-containing protein